MKRIALIIGVLGTAATAYGFATEPTQAAFSYLTAWLFAFSIAIGAVIFNMIGHATGARWGIAFRRYIEAIASALPLLAVMFVPIVLAAPLLYSWIDPSPALDPEAVAKLAHKAPYLNLTFWTIRAAIALVLWTVGNELLTRWSTQPRVVTLATGGLPVIALTLTFAVFDWLMSLTPLWYSTIFGLLFWSGGFVAALSLVAVIARDKAITPDLTGALGRLMFAFLVFWAYMEFSQGFIIWIANKPDEVPWYVARGAGAWGTVFGILIVGHFAVPFFAMLSRELKRRSVVLAVIGAWIIVMHYVDVYWLVMPVLHANIALHWLDAAAPCAVLGLAVAFAAARNHRTDPRFAEALTYKARG